MNKKAIIAICFIVLSVLSYAITYNSQEWSINNQQQLTIYEKDFPSLHSQQRIIDALSKVQYAAIVYPIANRIYPNSILHKYILGNPYDNTLYMVKAQVEYTIIGEPLSSIVYRSAGSPIEPYAIFVGLCESEGSFYAPENGFEFPATKEAIEFVKNIKKENLKITDNSVCPN